MSLFSKLGRSIKKRIIPAVSGFLSGGPVGALAAIGGTLIKSRPGGNGVNGVPRQISMQELRANPMSMQASIAGAFPQIVGAAGRAVARVIPGAGAIGRVAGRGVAVGRGLVRKYPKSARVLAELGLFAAGGLVFDAAGNIVGRTSTRRMNPLNHRALRRAISRVKSAKKICAQVERIAGPRRRAAPCPPRGRKC